MAMFKSEFSSSITTISTGKLLLPKKYLKHNFPGLNCIFKTLKTHQIESILESIKQREKRGGIAYGSRLFHKRSLKAYCCFKVLHLQPFTISTWWKDREKAGEVFGKYRIEHPPWWIFLSVPTPPFTLSWFLSWLNWTWLGCWPSSLTLTCWHWQYILRVEPRERPASSRIFSSPTWVLATAAMGFLVNLQNTLWDDIPIPLISPPAWFLERLPSPPRILPTERKKESECREVHHRQIIDLKIALASLARVIECSRVMGKMMCVYVIKMFVLNTLVAVLPG